MGTSPTTTDDTWINYTAFAFGEIGRLRLASDGVSPGPPDGVPMFFGPPLDAYYGYAIRRLTADLKPLGYSVMPFGYDWRLDPSFMGDLLMTFIVENVTADNPCTIVGHSFGGLVARYAWSLLVGAGQSNLVRRIVTLGTPHWGSYGAVELWSLDADQLDQIFYLTLASTVLTSNVPPPARPTIWTPTEIAAVSATFPSFYWTLPSLLAPDVALDPNRSAVYGSGWPADRGVTSRWLAAAVNSFQPMLASASFTPPAWVMTTVAGKGLPTVGRLTYPNVLGSARAYQRFDVGDGTVETSSALLAGSAQYTVTAGHQDLPRTTANSGLLTQLVLDARGPPTPPPPAVVVPGQLGQILAGPPSPQPIVAVPPIPRDP